MSRQTDLSRIVEVSRLRAASQARRLAAAQAIVAEASQVLANAEEAREKLAAELADLRAKASAAFVGSPQTAFAVEQMLSRNQANDRRLVDAQTAIDEAGTALADATEKAEAEAQALNALERTVKKRESAEAKVTRAQTRLAERKSEDALAEVAAAGALQR